MRRLVATSVAIMLALVQVPHSGAQVSAIGVITGTAAGPQGALAGATVQVLDAAGSIVGSAVTSPTGAFSIGGLNPGTFTVQIVGSNGAVVGASSATLSAAAMTATVAVQATAGAIAASATAAVAGAAAAGTAGGVATGTVLAAVGAAAAAAGTAAVIANEEDASGSR